MYLLLAAVNDAAGAYSSQDNLCKSRMKLAATAINSEVRFRTPRPETGQAGDC